MPRSSRGKVWAHAHEHKELLLGAALLLAVFFLIGAEFPLAQERTVTLLTVLSPSDHATFEVGDAVSFRAQFVSRVTTQSLTLYLRRGGFPQLSDAIHNTVVRSSETYLYTLDTSTLDAGTYYWYILADDLVGGQVQSEVYEFTLEAVDSGEGSSGSTSTSTGYVKQGNTGPGSCPGGVGGYTAELLGEKTFFYATLFPNIPFTVKYNKADLHGVEKITLFPLQKLGSNALVVNQRILTTSLPDIRFVYKVFDIQMTTKWPHDSFWATIYFRVPKEKIVEQEFVPQNASLWSYAGEEWNPLPTLIEEERENHYLYRADTFGFHPFAIGVCDHTFNGYKILDIPET